MSVQVGDKFRLFKNGKECQVIDILNGKVKFEVVEEGELAITGSFPINRAEAHGFKSKKEKKG